MENELRTQIRQRYRLESALSLQRRVLRETREKLPQARYLLRCRVEAETGYDSSFRAFLDGFSGKREERRETLSREKCQAEAELDALLRFRESLERDCGELSRELEGLPSLQELKQAAAADPETLREWAVPEARFCAEELLPLLEGNLEALREYRSLLQGSRPEVLSSEAQQQIFAEPDKWAAECLPLLKRLQEALEILEIPFKTGRYYGDYRAFLVSAAARHNRLDRVNRALEEVNGLKNLVRDLPSRLE